MKVNDLVWAWSDDWFGGEWMTKEAADQQQLYRDHTGLWDSRFYGILFEKRNCPKDNCHHNNHPEVVMTTIEPGGSYRW